MRAFPYCLCLYIYTYNEYGVCNNSVNALPYIVYVYIKDLKTLFSKYIFICNYK